MSFSRQLLKNVHPASRFVAGSSATQGTLPVVLSLKPQDGVGSLVRQTRWDDKGIPNTYWEITRVKLKNEGKNGKAWGKFYWKGKLTTKAEDEPITGLLKYAWRPYSRNEIVTLPSKPSTPSAGSTPAPSPTAQ